MGIEQRRSKRVAYPLEVYLNTASGGRLVRLENISMGGCLIRAIGLPPPGGTVMLEVRMPGGRWINLQGFVVRQVEPNGAGISFVSPTETELALLDEVVNILSRGREA
ncbi:MAG: PilZ domain-containing protein [Pyrinomonadaceae bacterium]